MINTQESLQTETGYISVKYNAVFRNPKNNELKGKRYFRENYEKFGNYYLPTYQAVDSLDQGSEKITTEFNFSNIKLLEPALVGT